MNTFKVQKKQKKELEQQNSFFYIVKSILYAYLFTILVFIIYGTLITYTELTENNIQVVVMITTVISVIISGFITSKGVRSKGLVFGMLSGLIYFAINLMVNFCVSSNFSFNSKTIIILILSIFGGGLGGIIGINMKKQ